MEYKLPEGNNTMRVKADLEDIRKKLMKLDYVEHVTTSVGSCPGRYNLVRSIPLPTLSYGKLIVDFKSARDLETHIDELQQRFAAEHPDAYLRFKRYNLMFMRYPIEMRITGSDPAVLHQLADTAMSIAKHIGVLDPITSDWEPRVPTLTADYDQARAEHPCRTCAWHVHIGHSRLRLSSLHDADAAAAPDEFVLDFEVGVDTLHGAYADETLVLYLHLLHFRLDAKKLLTTFTRADSPSVGCLSPDAMFQFQDATHALVNALLCDFTGFYSLDYRVESLREHLRTEHDVDTSLDTAHGSLAVGVLLGDGSHLHRVGDDEVLIAQFTAQLVLQNDR